MQKEERKQQIDEISGFLQGHNDLKYLVNVETYYYKNVADCIIHPPNQEPFIKRIPYTPFLYLKDLEKNGIELYGGDVEKKKQAIEKYGITVEYLITENQPRLEEGFTTKISSSISYQSILDFLKYGGVDMWEKYELKSYGALEFPVPLYDWYNEELHKLVIKALKKGGTINPTDKDDKKAKANNKVKKKRRDAIKFLVETYYKYDSSGKINKGIIEWAEKLIEYLTKLINNSYKYKHLFFSVKTDEQFFISTGCRLYKGFENYNEVHKLTLDIETTGLRPEYCRVFEIGIKDNRGNQIILEAEKDNDDKAERDLILKMFNYINHIKPAIVAGFNIEKFDFDFILVRAEKLGIYSSKLPLMFRTTLDNEEYTNKEGYRVFAKKIRRRPNSSVKFGGSTERYTATHMWGYSVIDILHAAKRTAAINSEMKNTKLKYICKFEKIAKKNRMYVDDGLLIHKKWRDNKINIINPVNNNYEEIPAEFQKDAWKLYDLQHLKEKMSDAEYLEARKEVIQNVSKNTLDWLRGKITKYTQSFKLITGNAIIEQYLLDDLWETEQVDELYNQSSFLLAKIIPTTYSRICTMGNAAVWNLIMTTWSYEKGLAIPSPDKPEKFSGGLARCFKKGYSKRITKIDFKGMYPSDQLEYDIFPIFDITGVIKKILYYLTTQRNEFKFLAGDKSPLPKAERNSYKVKQLPLKILNNSLFGALGSGIAFNWSDNTCAARITCTGRIQLRQAITWFKQYSLDPLLAVTDGINFSYPSHTTFDLDLNVISFKGLPIEEAWVYEVDGKKYTGIEAVVEKFNKEVANSEYVGVDLDGFWQSSLNLSRINYANLTNEEIDEKTGEKVKPKIKFTGNTIKSKVMSEYIEDFIDKGLNLILNGKGEEFVEYYNEYVKQIFFKQIPLRKIATKKRFKHTVQQYLNRGTDKNGRKKAKQAHMELIIQERSKLLDVEYKKVYGDEPATLEEKLQKAGHLLPPEPELDSYIYYYNAGLKKGQSDSKTIKTEDGKEELAVKMISPEDFENNPDITGNYNSSKYVAAFNNRVKAILEGFKPEVRKQILISDPAKREYLEPEDLQLQNFIGDDYEESLVLEEKELEYWNRTGLNPSKIWDGFKIPSEDALIELKEYQEKVDYLNNKFKETGQNRVVKSVNDKVEEGEFLLIKNFKNYSLHVYTGTHYRCVRKNVVFPDSNMIEFDFIEGGLSKATIDLKREYVDKFKDMFKVPKEVKLSTIPRALEMFEEYYNLEIKELKKKKKKGEIEDLDDDFIFGENGKIELADDINREIPLDDVEL